MNMREMVYTWLMVLFIAYQYAALASPAVVSTRNLLQFNNMINYKNYSSWDYNGYGCWCGSGTYGSLALDATDDCCRIHDQCYDQISGGFFGCSPKLVTYAWEKQPNKAIVCTDPIDTCDRNACDCDKVAADCFEKHRSTYHSGLRKLGSVTEKSIICNP